MKNVITLLGKPAPLGATYYGEYVNFSLFAPHAIGVDLVLFETEDDQNPKIIPLNPEDNKTFYYWHIAVPHLQVNQLYGYRVHGDYAPEKGWLFDGSKVLVDPYAKSIVGKPNRKLAATFGACNLHDCLKSAVVDHIHFDWENDCPPHVPLKKSIIYEMHVGGFTKHHSSKTISPGTFTALKEKIPYLKSLGITTVELLPIFAFDPNDAPPNRLNFWGYSPLNFFALHAPFCHETTPQNQINEFKNLVKELHKAGMEVILDVVFNHTTENDIAGPTYNLRGIANDSYYILDEHKNYADFTGTGNTLNASHSVVRRMIRQSLRYWVDEMHIDGFRFDLASVLSRDENGVPIPNPPILWSIESDPYLAGIKLIAEAWDAKGLYQVDNFVGHKWMIWNDKFRDTIRKFLKGDEGVVPKVVDYYLPGLAAEKRSIHFITAHDGFTLHDLVSYNEKHNHNNLEENRDGHHDNLSWNCGLEGETEDAKILNLRKKQMKNAFCLLFLSRSIPMMLGGDEIARTQKGNNNSYCQDNELNWFNWGDIEKKQDLVNFVKELIKLRKKAYFIWGDLNQYKAQIHGTRLNHPDYGNASRSFAVEYSSKLPKTKDYFVIFNMYWKSLNFEIPSGNWNKIIQTDENVERFKDQKLMIPPRSVVVLEKE